MLGRLMRSADFESVLATPAKARSAHFAAHHLASAPAVVARRGGESGRSKLSTDDSTICAQAVDDLPKTVLAQWWLGTVVPKRHARKAATRNLLRRQIRSAMTRYHGALAPGIWLVRLRAPFDPRAFASATSTQLRVRARQELERLLAQAAA